MDYLEWKNKIKPEKRIRTYRHIDAPLNIEDERVFSRIVTVISNLKSHQFLPFIKRVEKTVRFRRDKGGLARRKLKLRPIMYASHLDSNIYSYFNYHLLKIYESLLQKEGISESVIAYRKIKIPGTERGKNNVYFAKEVFDYIKLHPDNVVITQDIEGFFDNINHSVLKKKLCEISGTERLDDSLFKVYKSLTTYRYIEYSDFESRKFQQEIRRNRFSIFKFLKKYFKENKTNKGIPQGSPISGLLANISLFDFDRSVKRTFPNVFYRRYSDDLVFICKRNQRDALLEFIDEKIKKVYLKINAKKSFISYFKASEDGIFCEKVTNGLGDAEHRGYVDYLGLEFTGGEIFFRKNTIQKLKHKQIVKSQRNILNSLPPNRRRPKQEIKIPPKRHPNYLRRTAEIIGSQGIQHQVLKVARDRNRSKRPKEENIG